MPSQLETQSEGVLKHLRALREEYTRQHSDDPLAEGLRPVLYLYRGGREVCAIHVAYQHPEGLHEIIWRSVIGFSADTALMGSETWGVYAGHPDAAMDVTDGSLNPDTGKTWASGEMGEYVAKHGRGLVRDGIFVLGANAAGDIVIAEQTFAITSSSFGGHKMKWDEAHTHVEGSNWRAAGNMTAVMREAFTKTGVFATHVARVQAELDISTEAATAMTDMATVQGLQLGLKDALLVILSAAEDEVERREVIARIGGRPMHSDFGQAFKDAGL